MSNTKQIQDELPACKNENIGFFTVAKKTAEYLQDYLLSSSLQEVIETFSRQM